jgi:hypothetical protein
LQERERVRIIVRSNNQIRHFTLQEPGQRQIDRVTHGHGIAV